MLHDSHSDRVPGRTLRLRLLLAVAFSGVLSMDRGRLEFPGGHFDCFLPPDSKVASPGQAFNVVLLMEAELDTGWFFGGLLGF